MQKKKILITGATGFIGQHLTEELVKNDQYDYEIYCGVRKTSNTSFLETLDVNFRHLDLNDYDSFPSAVENIDTVIHLAANFDFHAKKQDLIKYNVEATEKLARACLEEQKVDHFVYCSSTEALGVVENGNENAEYNPDDNYGLSKQKAEQMLFDLAEEESLPLTIVRPSGVYGPGDQYVFTEIIQALDKGVVKAIPGDGKANIHFTYITDIVQGFCRIIEQPEKSIGETFIIASDEPQSYLEIIETVAEILEVKPPSLHVPPFLAKLGMPLLSFYYKLRGVDLFPLRANAVQKMTSSRSYSNSKIKDMLGYQPRIKFQEGVKKTVYWLQTENLL